MLQWMNFNFVLFTHRDKAARRLAAGAAAAGDCQNYRWRNPR